MRTARGTRLPGGRTRKLAGVAALGVLAVACVAALAGPAGASSGVDVYVGYADNFHTAAATFPTPWDGSPNTTFEGCTPAALCAFDAGAVMVANNTASPVTVDAIAVHIDTCTYTGWPSAALAPGHQLIVTQTATGANNGCTGPDPSNMDTSDIGPGGSAYAGNCTPDGVVPTVDVTVDGVTTTYTDSGQVLNTGGVDAANCTPQPGPNSEATQWTLVGSAPCAGSSLTLAPPSQTDLIGTTATMTATFENGCGTPLPGVLVTFTAQSGPNAGLTGTGVTDASGNATFSYSSALVGTDTWQASVTNPAGEVDSNTVTVTWTVNFAQGGSFVIGDRENVAGGNVTFWGAQWWKDNPMSTGSGPAGFKGFENGNTAPTCGGSWTSNPGNSSGPPATIPPYMAVIVSSHVGKSGPTISGDILHIVVVKTDPGYGPDPGHAGTGTITQQLC